MPIEPDLLDILASPERRPRAVAEETRDGAPVLVCTYCASSYPITDGIPVLLLDEATPGPHGLGVAAEGG